MTAPELIPAARLRGRARLLEFLKFRVLASQEAFFEAWLVDPPTPAQSTPAAPASSLPPLDLHAFRCWLQALWPETEHLSDEDLRHGLEQAHRLYVDASPRRHG